MLSPGRDGRPWTGPCRGGQPRPGPPARGGQVAIGAGWTRGLPPTSAAAHKGHLSARATNCGGGARWKAACE
ncbi:hypothetical protein B296_00051447 [Ensete ventricosum]|uniref:Uncharacterized protein n=1 Tax=Ensete ventricosum TaxID=4639 RepID=A0A426XS38_ENSVE|nr:hypothetical protein B296_00051447 [Ensete ventricosum]